MTTTSRFDEWFRDLKGLERYSQPAEERLAPDCRLCPWPRLYTISTLLSRWIYDLDETLARIVDETLAVTRANRGLILLFNEQGELEPRVGRTASGRPLSPEEIRTSRTITDQVVAGGRSIFIENVAETQFSQAKSVQDLALVSVMCVPLLTEEGQILPTQRRFKHLSLPSRGRCMGVIYVDSPYLARRFADSDLFALEALANNATAAIVNAHLFKHYVRETELRQSVNVARGVQQRLLPSATPALAGLDLGGWCRPSREVGGDYLDWVPVADARTALVVGDVSGHGLGSALLMATARAFLRALLDQEDDLGRAMRRLNTLLKRDCESKMFMTCCLVLLDPARRQFRYVNAGHDLPLLYRRVEDRFVELEATGPALALFDEADYGLSRDLQLDPGDLLLVMTDGIWEERAGGEAAFGRARVREVLRRHRDRPAATIVQEITREVEAFLGGREPTDDMTVALVKCGAAG